MCHLATPQSTTRVTIGDLRFGRSTLISPARSRSRSTRRFVSRPAPCFCRRLLGSEKVVLLVRQAQCSSSASTTTLGALVAFAASTSHHSGIFTNGLLLLVMSRAPCVGLFRLSALIL